MEQETQLNENYCIKCQDPNSKDEKMTIVKDGIEKIIEFSCRTNNQTLKDFLEERRGTDQIKIHRDCQRTIYNALKRKSQLLKDQFTPPEVPTRRDSFNFEWKRDCFFCDKPCKVDKHHRDRIDWQQVRTLPMRDKIMNICQQREDKQSEEISKKLLSIHDLVAAEGRYHNKCKQEFYSGSLANTETPGRPKNSTRNENFEVVCEWLEAGAEVHTLSEVYKKMLELLVLKNAHTHKSG